MKYCLNQYRYNWVQLYILYTIFLITKHYRKILKNEALIQGPLDGYFLNIQ